MTAQAVKIVTPVTLKIKWRKAAVPCQCQLLPVTGSCVRERFRVWYGRCDHKTQTCVSKVITEGNVPGLSRRWNGASNDSAGYASSPLVQPNPCKEPQKHETRIFFFLPSENIPKQGEAETYFSGNAIFCCWLFEVIPKSRAKFEFFKVSRLDADVCYGPSLLDGIAGRETRPEREQVRVVSVAGLHMAKRTGMTSEINQGPLVCLRKTNDVNFFVKQQNKKRNCSCHAAGFRRDFFITSLIAFFRLK